MAAWEELGGFEKVWEGLGVCLAAFLRGCGALAANKVRRMHGRYGVRRLGKVWESLLPLFFRVRGRYGVWRLGKGWEDLGMYENV